MRSSRRFYLVSFRSADSGWHGVVRTAVAAGLCLVMAGQPMFAAAAGLEALAPSKKVAATPAGEIQGRERVVHALNRLTFGPRPGDVAAVEAMGLNKWFELQLNPQKIDDSRLEARLAEFPAMQMSIAELSAHFPGPQAVKAMEEGKIALPSDPTERAVAIDEIAFYKMQKAKKEQNGAAEKSGSSVSAGGAMPPDSTAAIPAAQANSQLPSMQRAGKKRQAQVSAGMDALNDSGMDMAGGQADKAIPASEIAPDGMMAGTDSGGGRGYSRDAALAILNLPPDQRLHAVLTMPAAELVSLRQSLNGREMAQLTEGMTPAQKETLASIAGAVRMVAAETMESRVLRDVYSERQLEAVMTDFWLNHFNVYVRKNQIEPYLIPSYERDTIRPHALGKFEDLLVATAKSPAMLVYLDNWRSIGAESRAADRLLLLKQFRPNSPLAKNASAGLNENYGRELMELHTLGVNGGYTQADVTQVAKVFTGWTVDKPYGMGKNGGGTFKFDDKRHEPGPKMVLGKKINEGGEKEGLEVLHMLATSPATAHFLCEKLAVRFVSDTPPAALVDRMAQSFLSSQGDIKTVLRMMFASPEFWSPGVERAKVKTPEEFVFSAVRASGLEVKNALPLVMSLDKLGMPLYGMQTPNGYSWKQDEWVSTGALVTRMNFALVMSGGRLPGTNTEWSRLLGESAGVKNASFETAGGGPQAGDVSKEKALEMILLGVPVSERTRRTVLGQAGDQNVAEQAATEFNLQGGGGGKQAAKYGKGFGRQLNGAGAVVEDPQAAVMAGLLLGSPEFQRR